MAKKIKKLSELYKHLEKQIQSSKSEVAEVAVKTMSDAVVEDVYNEYDPTEYERRGRRGGLADPSNYTVEIVNDSTISIRNDTTGNERYSDTEGWDMGAIDGIIVYGTGYHWSESKIYQLQPFPRDFYGGTVRRLKRGNLHINAMKEGLIKRGIKVK